MALSQRDIVITPNRGASTEPTIRFTGADASSSATITLRVINSSTVGTLSFEGTSGQLFSVTDSMVGTIFSVNDVSGIPSIEVLDTGLVKLAQYNGSVTISTATSISGAKLTVQGGVYVNGTVTATNFVGAFTGAVTGAATQLNTTANINAFEYIVGVAGSGSAQNAVVATTVPVGFNASTGYVGINTTSPSTRLVIDTGATTNAGAQLLIGPSSGTAVVGDKVIIGFKLQNTAGGGTGNTYAAAIGGIQDVSANNGGALGFYTQSSAGDGTPERMRISTVGSVGINTAAPRSKFEVVSGTALTNDDPAGYAASFVGSVGTNQFATVSIASNDAMAANVGGTLSFGGIYQTGGTGFANWASIKGLKTNATSGDYGGYLSFFTRLTGAGNLERLRITGNGGISFGATGTAVGTAGQVLQSNGDAAPTWVAPSGLTVSTANNAVNIRTIAQTANASYFPTFVNSNNATNAYELVYTTGTFVINPSTGDVGIGTTSPTARLHIAADASGESVFRINGQGGTNATVIFADVDIGGQGYGGAYLSWGRGGSYDNWFMINTRSSSNVSVERLRITQNGGIAFGGAANYGTSGFILKSNGDAAPTWVAQSTIAAGSAPLTNTYVGFGSASNLLTGSSNLTWSGTQLLATGQVKSTAVATLGSSVTQGNPGATDVTANATLLLSGVGGNYLAFGQTTSAVQWIQSAYTNPTTAVYPIALQPLGGNVGIGTTAPAYKLDFASVNGLADAHMIRMGPNNGASGLGGGGVGGAVGGNQSVGGGLIFAPNYTGYTKRSAGILQVGEGNYFRSGLAFYTNNVLNATTDWSEAMRIGSNGNVSIGAGSSPLLLNKFEVSGTAGQLFSVTDSFVGTIFSANDVSGVPSIEVLDTGLVKLAQYNGQVAISTGTVVTGSALTVYGILSTLGASGEIRASSEITAYYSSDARLKENISIISDPIAMIKQINGVYFDWTDDYMNSRGGEDGFFVRKHDIGVIAQEVEAILPEIVATRESGYKAVKYEKIVPLLIESIKAQQITIETLTSELKEIKEFILSIKEK